MNNKGMDFLSYVSAFADNAIENAESLMRLNEADLREYRALLDKFKIVNGSAASTADKGKTLEEIVSFLLHKSAVFEVYENVRTSTNEIDLLTRLSPKGEYFLQQGLLNFERAFLCECKNYDKGIDVTWVGKFFSLLKVSQNSLGIIFSFHGLKGRGGWNSALGLTKKIYLSDKDDVKIIDFNIKDFEAIASGASFIKIIKDKIFDLQNDTKISHHFEIHPNQDLVESLLK